MNILDLLDEIQTSTDPSKASTNPFDVAKGGSSNLNSSLKKGTNNNLPAGNPFALPQNFNKDFKENYNFQASALGDSRTSNNSINNPFGATSFQTNKAAPNNGFGDWGTASSAKNQNQAAFTQWTGQKSEIAEKKQNDFSSFSSFGLGWDNWKPTTQEPDTFAKSSFGGFERLAGSTLAESRSLSDSSSKATTGLDARQIKRDLVFVNNKNVPYKIKIDSSMDSGSCLNEILSAMNEKGSKTDVLFESERGERIEPKDLPWKLVNSTSNGFYLLNKTDLHAFWDEEDRNQKIKLEIDPLEHYEVQEAFSSLVEGVHILKVSDSGKLKLRHLQILPGHNKLVVYSLSKPLSEKTIEYCKIKEIKLGQKTEVFKYVKLSQFAHLSCSLVYDDFEDYGECMNFLCKTQEDYDKVVAALKALSSKALNKNLSKSVLFSHSEAFNQMMSEKKLSTCSLFKPVSLKSGPKTLNDVSDLKFQTDIKELLIKYTPEEYGKGFFMEEVDKLIHESRSVRKACEQFENEENLQKVGTNPIPSELDMEGMKVLNIYRQSIAALTVIVNKVIEHYDQALLNYFNYNPPAVTSPLPEFTFSVSEEEMLKEIQFLVWWVHLMFGQCVKIAENISKARKTAGQRVSSSIGSFFENTKKNIAQSFKSIETAVDKMNESMGSQNVAAFDKFSKDLTNFNQSMSNTFRRMFGGK